MRTLILFTAIGFLLVAAGCTDPEPRDEPTGTAPQEKPAGKEKVEKTGEKKLPPPKGSTEKPEKRPPYAPYPGGSPFPPGGEPSLTHVVQVFWTTEQGTATEIRVDLKGERPSQVYLYRGKGDRRRTVSAFIAPQSNHALRIVPDGWKTGRFSLDGSGTLEVKVFGFRVEDYDRPPTVNVRYLRDGKELPIDKVGAPAEARPYAVARQPVSKKLKKK